MGKFAITRRTEGQYQFSLKEGNGEVILTSQGYSTRVGCLNGIESVRKNAPDDRNYERKTSYSQKFYFNLKAANGEIIGTSEIYKNIIGRETAIASVKSSAPAATFEDLS